VGAPFRGGTPHQRLTMGAVQKNQSTSRTTGRRLLPRLYWTGVRSALPPARHTSSQDPHGRTALPSLSTAGSEMSFSTLSCSPRLPRLNSWLIAGGSTTHSGRIRPSRGVRPGGSSTGSCSMNRLPTLVSTGPMKGVTSVEPSTCTCRRCGFLCRYGQA